MNIRAAVIHIIGDIVQSIGVVIAAIIIYFKPEWHLADPITTFIFTFLCLFTTIPIFKDCVVVLMEATPKGLEVTEVFKDLVELDTVEEIHDFHVWSLSVGKIAMSAHIRSSVPHVAIAQMTEILKDKYQIFHTTIQAEKSNPVGGPMCCDNDKQEQV
jgi:solute carrier family 30 (zinc transporter), member 2